MTRHLMLACMLTVALCPPLLAGGRTARSGGAASTRVEPGSITSLWDLASASPADYEGLFEHCQAPRLEDFRGRRFNGLILHVSKGRFGKYIFTQYTGKNSDLLIGQLYTRPLTFQKRFLPQDNAAGESGINFWPVRGVESMPMKIYLGKGLLDGAPALKVDYDVARNKPVVERPLVDEIRQVPGTSIYIGRMYFRLGDHAVPFLWFALERAGAL